LTEAKNRTEALELDKAAGAAAARQSGEGKPLAFQIATSDGIGARQAFKDARRLN
jgi:hypothetical protein